MTARILINGAPVDEWPLDKAQGFFGEHVIQLGDGGFAVSINHFLAATAKVGGETHSAAIRVAGKYCKVILRN